MGLVAILKRTLLAAALAACVAPAFAEKRVALVIGNSAYQNTGKLPNPQNDSADVGVVLEKLDFQVIKTSDLDKRGMDRAIASFARAATDADAALFFYAGHGMQYQGSNYLMPIDAKLEDEVSLTFEMTRVDDVLTALSRARGVKILILDACRDNPLAQRLQTRATNRSVGPTRGFNRIERTVGTLIAYATQAHDVAIDGVGSRNSPFTAALLKDIETPNLEVGALFRRVAAEVNRATGGKQTPELSVSILGEFYFKRAETDLQVWSNLRDSDRRADFEGFLARFPNSALADAARARIATLDRTEADRLARDQAERARIAQEEARARLARDLAEQQRLTREAAERTRQDNERLMRELAERELRVKEQLDRLAAAPSSVPPPPAAPVTQPLSPAVPAAPPAVVPAQTLAALPAIPALPARLPEAQPGSSLAPALAPAPARADLVRGLKKELKRVGCYSGPEDGAWPTKAGEKALADFQLHAGRPPAPLSAELLASVKSQTARVCPLACAAGKQLVGSVCVAIAAPPVVRPARPAAAPPAPKPRPVAKPRPATPRPTGARPRPPAGGGGERCFNFNGQRFCE